MVKHVSIQNFKSIKSLEFEAKRVNVFIGEPNAGKSNILEALGMTSFFYNMKNLKDFVRYHSIDNVFYDNDISKNVFINFDEFTFSIGYLGGNQYVFSMQHGLSNTHSSFVYMGDKLLSGKNDLYSNLWYYKFKFIENLNSSELAHLLPPYGENLFSVLRTNKKFRKIASDIFESKKYRLGLRMNTGEVEMIKDTGDELYQYPYQSVSDTLQRIIFYLAAIETHNEATLLLEEPEANTFPYYTKHLAERIAADESNQYFLVTHNPYFLNSLVQQTTIEQLNVFVAYMEEYQTKLRKLSEDDFSKILDLDKEVFYNLDILGQPA